MPGVYPPDDEPCHASLMASRKSVTSSTLVVCGVDLLCTEKKAKAGPARESLLERMGDKIQISDGCWEWTGTLTPEGYGRISRGGGGAERLDYLLTHRLLYELLVGPIPDGLVLDHLCRVRRCCNPLHLEPVTQKENTLRSPVAPAAINARKTHCPRGHLYDMTYYNVKRKQAERGCRRCKQAHGAAYRQRNREVQQDGI